MKLRIMRLSFDPPYFPPLRPTCESLS